MIIGTASWLLRHSHNDNVHIILSSWSVVAKDPMAIALAEGVPHIFQKSQIARLPRRPGETKEPQVPQAPRRHRRQRRILGDTPPEAAAHADWLIQLG